MRKAILFISAITVLILSSCEGQQQPKDIKLYFDSDLEVIKIDVDWPSDSVYISVDGKQTQVYPGSNAVDAIYNDTIDIKIMVDGSTYTTILDKAKLLPRKDGLHPLMEIRESIIQ